MGMSDSVWRRHANPWSVYTRIPALPMLALAIWSRDWIGWWSICVLVAVCFWIWWNPRAFPEPRTFNTWASKGVLGERIFIEHRLDVPRHHIRAAHILAWASLPGVLILVIGLWVFWWEGAFFGVLLAMLPKIWFVDRMVWVLEDWRREGRKVPGMNDGEI